MSALWTGEALAAATGGRLIGQAPERITGVSIDSRSLNGGEAFFAITGERTDGHDFLSPAADAGAGVLVVREDRLGEARGLAERGVAVLAVPDVLGAMERTGAAARARFAGQAIAVTGSAGKTTTKEMLRRALSASGTVHASDKSFNNHWGVPLTLARLPQETDFAVFEIGMNHAGEIRPLVKLARPHVAIVTLIAPAHLGHFNDLGEIAAAKAEIFEGLVPGGAALLNRDDAHFPTLNRLAEAASVERRLSFGEHAQADIRLLSVTLSGDRSDADVSVLGERVSVRLGAPGRHIVQNALAVLGAAHLTGADVRAAASALADLAAERGRGARHVLGQGSSAITLIDESYNANPTSMRAALQLLAATPVGADETGAKGRRVAVLGDMRELGRHSERLHAELADAVRDAGVDVALLVGPETRALRDALGAAMPVEHRESVSDLEPLLLQTLRSGDAVMIKSSNGVGSSRLVEAVLARFAVSPERKRA